MRQTRDRAQSGQCLQADKVPTIWVQPLVPVASLGLLRDFRQLGQAGTPSRYPWVWDT